MDRNGVFLRFRLLSEIDPGGPLYPIFWRVLCRIGMSKRDRNGQPLPGSPETLLTVQQFLAVFRRISTSLSSNPSALSHLPAVNDLANSLTLTKCGECPVCFDAPADHSLSCGHAFCGTCITKWLEKNPSCPLCRSVSQSGESWELLDPPSKEEMGNYVATSLAEVQDASSSSIYIPNQGA